MTGQTADTQALDEGGIPRGDLARLAEAFELGKIVRVMFLPAGMMNRNWQLETSRGVFALKQIIDVPVSQARRSLRVQGALAAGGLPVCAPRFTTCGQAVAEIGGHAYCLLPWAGGEHRTGLDLGPGEAGALGVLVGRIHRALASPAAGLEPVTGALRPKVCTPADGLAEADRFLAIIADRTEPDAFDTVAAEALERRKALIAAHGDQRPSDEGVWGPVGWTHGDVQPLNLLWENGVVTAVLDWDRLRIRPYGEEVVRTARVQFAADDGRWDLKRVEAFTVGYRSVIPISDTDLVDAVERQCWDCMTEFWQLKRHYAKHDHSSDHLWSSGERLLHWWNARRDQVRAAFMKNP
ncbi:phosphotransferase (plasmid) [Streptosporangium sp. NBC_01495]|uniref:phosphotransferase n=1 Tax=Streptosporangium sp. NBC_01495 TaxID=2903899 RepID=UPI002E2FD52C|nr:phosphotransferase [Streptosporangium sp. NBC_01495]